MHVIVDLCGTESCPLKIVFYNCFQLFIEVSNSTVCKKTRSEYGRNWLNYDKQSPALGHRSHTHPNDEQLIPTRGNVILGRLII